MSITEQLLATAKTQGIGDQQGSLTLPSSRLLRYNMSNLEWLVCNIYYHKEMLEKLIACEGERSIFTRKCLVASFNLLEVDARIVEVLEEMWCEGDDVDDLARARARVRFGK